MSLFLVIAGASAGLGGLKDKVKASGDKLKDKLKPSPALEEGIFGLSSKYIAPTHSLEEGSAIFRKVLNTNTSSEKGLQNYADALNVAKKETKIPLISSPNMCTKSANKCSEYPMLKVYTDNDDTVKCSGAENAGTFGRVGAGIAGSDDSCIHNSYYAGVAQLYHELSTDGNKENGKVEIESKKNWKGKVFMVSASPKPSAYPKGTFMAKLMKEYYPGSLTKSLQGVAGDTWLLAAIVKANTIYKEVEKAPKLKNNIVWFGDDGQGDALTAVMVTDVARVSFIHRVSSDTGNQLWLGAKKEEVLLKDHVKQVKNVVYFNTHPEAAELAKDLKLISAAAATRVHKETLNSALGTACCEGKTCDFLSAANKWDNTCGPEVNDKIKTLTWESKYCAPVRDAWSYYSKQYLKGDKTKITCGLRK